MSKSSALILLGILVMVIPFSGIPVSVRSFLLVVFGVMILGIGLYMRTHR